MRKLDVLCLEPWHGGSHKAFLANWQQHTSHAVRVMGLPPRHWRWRMSAAAHTLAERATQEGPRPDVLFVSDFVDVARLYGHLPASWRGVPTLLYFHENQLTYPQQAEHAREDLTPGWTNLDSCLAASCVVFNTHHQRNEVTAAAESLFGSLPKPQPRAAVRTVLERSRVIYPGIDLASLPLGVGSAAGSKLRLAFNHRWEHDKNPSAFLLGTVLADAGRELFELVLLGERGERRPAELDELLGAVAPLIVHDGYAHSRAEYAQLLGSCDAVISTARHEFYGISMLEGVATGCLPIAPNALSYPEVLSGVDARLMDSDADNLVEHLRELLEQADKLRDPAARATRRATIAQHDVTRSARQLDELCTELVGA